MQTALFLFFFVENIISNFLFLYAVFSMSPETLKVPMASLYDIFTTGLFPFVFSSLSQAILDAYAWNTIVC